MVERRINPQALTKQDLEDALALHTNDEMPKIKALVVDAVEEAKHSIYEAFPLGDIHAHRAAHEQMMKAAEAEQAFWAELKNDVVKKSIWGILQILAMLIFGSLAVKFGFGAILGSIK